MRLSTYNHNVSTLHGIVVLHLVCLVSFFVYVCTGNRVYTLK